MFLVMSYFVLVVIGCIFDTANAVKALLDDVLYLAVRPAL